MGSGMQPCGCGTGLSGPSAPTGCAVTGGGAGGSAETIGVDPAVALAGGKTIVSVVLPLWSVTLLASTDRKVQPL